MELKEEFYTEKRWLNWIVKVKESNFHLTEREDGPGGAVFVVIMDDVVLACLKVIARAQRGLISSEEAISRIDDIRDIVFRENEPLGEDADMMLESLRASLTAVFFSCQRYIAGDFDRKASLSDLIKGAIAAEESGDLDGALVKVSDLGARVIGGEALPQEAADLPYSMTAELIDGIDAIAAAMLGDDSYKEDDGTDDGSEDI